MGMNLKSSRHLYVGLLLRLPGLSKLIHNCYSSALANTPVLPFQCSTTSTLTLSPPHSSVQPPLLHPLSLATEIPLLTTEHTLLSCCLMKLSFHISVLSYKLLWPFHTLEEEAEGGLSAALKP